MQLTNNLFTIISNTEEELNSYCYKIHLNSDHYIYRAHFPEEPITPGVCIIQIARELLSSITSKNLEIRHVKNVKFINVLSPVKNPDIVFHINNINFEDNNIVKAQILVSDTEITFAKLSLELM